MCGFNIPNKSYWHKDYDKFSYFYKIEIISGDAGLGNCSGGSQSWQRDRKSEAPSKFLFFSKVDSFLSIRRYINSLMNFVKIPSINTQTLTKRKWCILENPHFGMDESLILKVRLKIAMFEVKFIDFRPGKDCSTGYLSATDTPRIGFW